MFYERMRAAEETREMLEKDIQKLRKMLSSKKRSGELIEFPQRDLEAAEDAA